jgi:hypothetical protein
VADLIVKGAALVALIVFAVITYHCIVFSIAEQVLDGIVVLNGIGDRGL